jgi:predicted HTH domain antitoxin
MELIMSTESLAITIPTEVKRALRIPEKELGDRLRLELAVHLYEEWLLPFGKAAALAQMSHWSFAEQLARRKITRHYTEEDLKDDIAFANSTGGSNGS